jgi:signal transduction histidine kinase
MKTFFAPPERSDDQQLRHYVDLVSGSPLVGGLMQAVSGLLAVLNEQRQILALNESLLEQLGLGRAEEVLGLRLGEAIRCVHAQDPPAGCGTTEHCISCGAAIAMVTSLRVDAPRERDCAVTVERDGVETDLYLRVRCLPVDLEGRRVLLLFLRDITPEQRRAGLEHAFFHDIGNTVNTLIHASELLMMDEGAGENDLYRKIYQSTLRLAREVNVQRHLVSGGESPYEPVIDRVTTGEVLEELRSAFAEHPAAENKVLRVETRGPEQSLTADRHLLVRILDNMVINALEASKEGDGIRIWVEEDGPWVSFCVWNRKPIPGFFQNRVFQRNYSTKAEVGRGIGTYSMRLFGETYLGGKVDFTTSEADGTTFRLRLPV